jgi:hypothetical protein
MTTPDDLLPILERIEAAVFRHSSPWLRGDEEGARYAGYMNKKAFRRWAREVGITPSIDGKLNFWKRADIDNARERGKR